MRIPRSRPLNLQYLVLIPPKASRSMGAVIVLITQEKRGVRKPSASLFFPLARNIIVLTSVLFRE